MSRLFLKPRFKGAPPPDTLLDQRRGDLGTQPASGSAVSGQGAEMPQGERGKQRDIHIDGEVLADVG